MENTPSKNQMPKIVEAFNRHLETSPQSSFAKLPGHQQRALLNEAHIQVLAHQLSESHGEWSRSKDNARRLLTAFCEYYAASPAKVEQLTVSDANTFYKYPFAADRKHHVEKSARAVARRIDMQKTEPEYRFVSPQQSTNILPSAWLKKQDLNR